MIIRMLPPRVSRFLLLNAWCFLVAWLVSASFPPSTFAESANILRYHTEAWGGLTNRDGTGLYHEVLQDIFGAVGIQVEVKYCPFRRSVQDVQAGLADIAGGTVPDGHGLLPSTYPIWESRLSALFHHSKMPRWKGFSTIADHPDVTVGPPGISLIAGMDVFEVSSRAQAVNMLVSGRMSYYIDTFLILTKLKNGEGEYFGFEKGRPLQNGLTADWDDFVIGNVARVPLFFVFQDTEEGRRFQTIFDAGMERLHRSGELARLYEKWNVYNVMPTYFTE